MDPRLPVIGLGSRSLSFSLAALLALAGCRQPAGSESRQAPAGTGEPALAADNGPLENGRQPEPPDGDCQELTGRLAELDRLAAADEAAGRDAWRRGDAGTAAARFSRAAARREKTGQVRWEVSNRLSAGLALRRMGEVEAARRHFLLAEELALDDLYLTGRAAAANNLALLEQDAGNFALARFHFRRALRLLAPESAPDSTPGSTPASRAEAALYRENLARLMMIEGENGGAAELLRRPSPGAASPSGLAELAWLLLLEQRPGEALAMIEAALAADPDDFTASVLHDRRGTALERLGRFGEARAAYLLALDSARGRAPASTAAAVAVNLCRLAVVAPPDTDGAGCANAVAAARLPGVPAATLASARLWQALELRRRGRLREAYAAARGAARAVAALRMQASSPERRSRFLEDRSLYAELAVELAMELHRRSPEQAYDRAALADSELWRARALADEVAGLRSGDPLQQELRDARRERRFPPTASEAAEYRVARLETRLQASRRKGRAEQPFDLHELQARLDADTTVFDLMLGEPRSYLWRIGARELASFELPPQATLERLAGRYLALIASPAATSQRASLLEAGRELAEALFGRDLERLEGSGRRLVFVGDGELAAFPLAALPTPGSTAAAPAFLVERKEIVALPSLRLLSILRQPRPAARQPSAALALVGDPWYGWEPWQRRLTLDPVPPAEARSRTGIAAPFALGRMPFSGLEMDRVAARFSGLGASLRAQGPAATRELALSGELDRFAVLHFSAHGELDPRNPASSALLLSELDPAGRRRQGRLTPEDLADLDWRAELAVASSCESAQGLPFRFEGLGGIARAFLYAGAGSSLASLWKVEGRSTATLMDHFYEALVDRRLGPGAALRAAQQALLSEARAAGSPWRAPYYWSGFALIGDWRAFRLPGGNGRAEHRAGERV